MSEVQISDKIRERIKVAVRAGNAGRFQKAFWELRFCTGLDTEAQAKVFQLRKAIERRFLTKGEVLCTRCDGSGRFPYFHKGQQRAVVGCCFTCSGEGKYRPKKGETHYLGYGQPV